MEEEATAASPCSDHRERPLADMSLRAASGVSPQAIQRSTGREGVELLQEDCSSGSRMQRRARAQLGYRRNSKHSYDSAYACRTPIRNDL